MIWVAAKKIKILPLRGGGEVKGLSLRKKILFYLKKKVPTAIIYIYIYIYIFAASLRCATRKERICLVVRPKYIFV